MDCYTDNLFKRLLSNIAISSPSHCWHWTAGVDECGYGRINVKGYSRGAHRKMYECCYGSIPEGLEVRHKCDNPTCCNPYHLELGTHQQNMADRHRTGKPIGPRGAKARTAKLNDEAVREIRIRVDTGEAHGKLAKEFGVHTSQIRRVVKRETWVDVV